MATDTKSLGLNTSAGDLSWKTLNSDHEDNPIVEALMKESNKLFDIDFNDNDDIKLNTELMLEFDKYLKENNLGSYFNNIPTVIDDKKSKKNKINKKELMKLNLVNEKNKKDIRKFLEKLKIDDDKEHYPLKKNKLYEAFLNIIYWCCYLIKNKNNSISIEVYFDASISLYRAIHDCSYLINDTIIDTCNTILNKVESIICKKNNNYIYELFSKYYYLITSSYWDNVKPNNIKLYNEQKDTIVSIYNSIKTDTPLLLFYWVPPANGKTLISAIIARIVSTYYREEQKIDKKDKKDKKEKIDKKDKKDKKILLYICYNDIVRNSVSSLCVTHNVDIKFWFASYHKDRFESYHIVDFRPYKNCFIDWRKKKSQKLYKKDEKSNDRRFSPDIKTQMYQYLEETRPLDIRENEININFEDSHKIESCDNLPEMIISDLDSAYRLLKTFPDLFIPYFDESFAVSKEKVTAQIMSVLPKQSVLVSATLAERDKIPTILENFKGKHNAMDDNIKYIYSNKQHINCEFISPDGYIISPHHNLKSCTEIEQFVHLMHKNPLIQRGYSNLIVLEMYMKLHEILPNELKLTSLFEHLGSITNESIREYGMNILLFCKDNEEYFEKIKHIKVAKINDNKVENIFTKNSYIFSEHNTLHVSNPTNFSIYVNDITEDFLRDSPKLKKLISDYKKAMDSIDSLLQNIEKNVKADNKDYEIQQVNKKRSEIKFNYPSEYITNSISHFNKWAKEGKLNIRQHALFNIEIINNFNDIMSKLYLSSIGIYNHSELSSYELEVFLKDKDIFKFIISDPSITYGTNINLTMVDIHENLVPISTRNTLYQLIGRSGRKGKSSSANIIFRSWDLFNIIVSNNDINEEAENIENNLIEILNN